MFRLSVLDPDVMERGCGEHEVRIGILLAGQNQLGVRDDFLGVLDAWSGSAPDNLNQCPGRIIFRAWPASSRRRDGRRSDRAPE